MPIDLSTIGMMAAQAGTQLAVDTASGAVKSRRGYKYSNMLANEQQNRNKEMTDYNMTKQLEMWEKTGYGAQKDQLKRAGLNTALMYGMGGGGGQTANVPGTSTGAPGLADTSSDSQGVIGMAMQRTMEMQLLKAQKENIEADTKNKQADSTLKDQQQFEIGLRNALEDFRQNYDEKGNRTEGLGQDSQAVTQLNQQLQESRIRIELLKQQGLTQEEQQKKLKEETQLLTNQVDWEALDIKPENIGKAIERLIKLLLK